MEDASTRLRTLEPRMPVSSSSKVLKRKASSSLPHDTGHAPPKVMGASGIVEHGDVDTTKGEYETGRVVCEVCRKGVSFRDEDSGGFTLKHWDAHRLSCASPAQTGPETVIYTPESTAEALANPPAKRRRAKRTEEERIEYLRADPYVAQFEAYRVLCASCDKWIRLRPNSTYCSIPWDAHRKSCLSKKISNKNLCALEERNTLFENDADVRKFDSERILCNNCDRWLAISSTDHLQAMQKWLQHRSTCRKSLPQSAPGLLPQSSDASLQPGQPAGQRWSPPNDQRVAPPKTISSPNIPDTSSLSPMLGPVTAPPGRSPDSQATLLQATSRVPSTLPSPTAATTTRVCQAHHNLQQRPLCAHLPHQPHQFQLPPLHQLSCPPSSHRDLNPANYQPTHESRRRNAEQRAATLRADPLIGEVEANRVFCSLCQKWVQLRQDSSYCAYPWLQHRGKCLARIQRRSQRVQEIEDLKAGKGMDGDQDDYLEESRDGVVPSEDDEPESEEGVDSPVGNDNDGSVEAQKGTTEGQLRMTGRPHSNLIVTKARVSPALGDGGCEGRKLSHFLWDEKLVNDEDTRTSPRWDSNARFDGGFWQRTSSSKAVRGPQFMIRRVRPVGLADLDSLSGRKQFIAASIDHLFRTTYECTDDMTISSLLAYLNAAMPLDKHEDFDTSEVTKAAVALHERGRIIFEGDVLRRMGE